MTNTNERDDLQPPTALLQDILDRAAEFEAELKVSFAIRASIFIFFVKRGRMSIGPSFGFEVFVPGRQDASA